MNLNPLDSRVGMMSNVNVTEIKEAIINEELYEWRGVGGDVIYGIMPGSELGRLLFPVVVGGCVVIDARSVIRKEDGKIISKWSWDRICAEAAMVDMSLVDDSMDVLKGFYVMSVQYMVGSRVSRAMSLDITDRTYLMNILCMYGLNQYEGYSVDEGLAVYGKYLIGSAVDREEMREWIEGSAGEVRTMEDVIACMRECEGASERFRRVDIGTVMDAVSGLAFGDNSAGLLVGLEVPAMWLANAYVVYGNTLYKKTPMMTGMMNGKKVLGPDKMEKVIGRFMKQYDFSIEK